MKRSPAMLPPPFKATNGGGMTQSSALALLRQRHKGKGVSPAGVIARVRRWAQAHNNSTVLAACQRAERMDKSTRK